MYRVAACYLNEVEEDTTTQHLLNSYGVHNVLRIFANHSSPSGGLYYPHSTDEEMEAQWGFIFCQNVT